jgi:hypothetical protein
MVTAEITKSKSKPYLRTLLQGLLRNFDITLNVA